MTTPDTTPSADARELYPDKNPGSDYGDAQWRRTGSVGVSQTMSVESVPQPENNDPSQLNLFEDVAVPMPDYLKNRFTKSSDDSEKYGHLTGASARELKRADEIAMKHQNKGRGPGR